MTGSATITAERSGYEPYSRTITLTAGGNNHDVSLSQSTGGTSVTGTVRGRYPVDGQLHVLTGATVSMAGKTDTTDASGNFQLPTIPEGNQTVTVTLDGWAPFTQSYFISSTNRTLTIELAYALPIFDPVVEWGACDGPCNTPRVGRSLLARLRPSTSITSSTPFAITAQYTYTVLRDGRALTMQDNVRRGNAFSCTVQCASLPGGSSGGTIHEGAAGTPYAAFNRWLSTSVPTPNPSRADPVIITWANVADGCTVLIGCADCLSVRIEGTITVRANQDTNQWTHYTKPFTSTTNWMIPANQAFCE